MRTWMAILALLSLLLPAQAQVLNERESQAANIGGQWSGRYYYSGQQANNPPVEFEMTLEVPVAGKVSGKIKEPNTFGSPDARFLYANVVGDISGNALRFIKTYDGTGGQSHSVTYSGTFSDDWTTLGGTWRLGNATGRFELRR